MADMAAADNLYARTQFHEYKRVIPFKVRRVEYKDGKKVLEYEEIVEKEVVEVLPPDITALIFWLKNRQPEHWRDRKAVDVSVSHHLLPPAERDEQLGRILARANLIPPMQLGAPGEVVLEEADTEQAP